jgi:hypothetical protein
MPIPAGPSTLPDWAPTLAEVADYTTARTLVPNPTTGANDEQDAFTTTTRPTAARVTRLIADACGWVTLKCGTIDETLRPQANTVASLFACGNIELYYPERSHLNREDAIATAKERLKQAEKARDELALANEALTGTDPQDSGFLEIAPVWSFPSAVAWGDQLLIP